ncbi:crotonase/enoyl-CoA hydratase family protein [Streptomyces sp. KL116D]|uniref:crotonase/enoyl-CoA hydratase family protein n=1 Tax=Streptomyces sp. KL116D TaxID=3045152 RepID=UPI003555BE5B
MVHRDYETLLVGLEERVLTVTLNRPEKLNAFNLQVMQDLLDVFDYADAEDEIRVVVVTGAGRGFCAGADVTRGGKAFDHGKSGAAHRDSGGRVALRVYACTKPVIAAVNGAAVGVGASMTLPMDIRLASEEAKFGYVFARRGIVPESAASWFLPRAVGMQYAMEWVATGRLIGPEEALASGLVRSVHPPDELLPAAYAIAREIADNTSAVSVALSRQMMWRMLGEGHPMEAHRLDSRIMGQIGGGPDPVEGVASFLEKRPPRFPGRVSGDMPAVYPWWGNEEFRPLGE